MQFSILFSDRGTPDGYRFLHGYSSHTLKLVNSQGKAHFVKFHFKNDKGAKNLSADEAGKLSGSNPDYATKDLFDAIEKGDYPTWTAQIQVMPIEDALKYKWNPFDVTKVWPHKDYPLINIGKLVLNRNPENYFAETEQAAFSPSHLVPGIEPSQDKMLQGRLFSYPDTHRHRLGVNYTQIPINTPYAAKVNNYHRDGFMAVNGNGGRAPNYEPNTQNGPKQIGAPAAVAKYSLQGEIGRHIQPLSDDDFAQVRERKRRKNIKIVLCSTRPATSTSCSRSRARTTSSRTLPATSRTPRRTSRSASLPTSSVPTSSTAPRSRPS